MPAISIQGLSKHYGSVHAVRGISFAVEPAEVFGFLGLNGAGKTTTIRMLLDLLRPSGGRAEIFGLDCQRDSLRTRAMTGYLPGELGFYSDMDGQESLDFAARLSGVPVSQEYRDRLLDRLELARADLRRPIRQYSTGMKRKLGLVGALQADPPLLILDEPTEGLDPLVQQALHEILTGLRARERTVFLSSHVLSEVERLCDRIAVIRKGEIVLLSTVAEARRLSGRVVHVKFHRPVAAIPLPDGMRVIAEASAESDARGAAANRWTIRVAGEVGELIPLLAQLPVSDIEIVEPALEDVLRSFYREGIGEAAHD